MKFADMIKLSFNNLMGVKSRFFICCMSISIGVFSVIIISSFGISIKSQIQSQLSDMGVNGLVVYQTDRNPGSKSFSTDQVKNLSDRLSSVNSAMPMISEMGTYRSQSSSDKCIIWGIDQQFKSTFDVKLIHGKLPDATDIKYNKNVAVIDDMLADKLYKRTNIIGKTVSVSLNGNLGEFNIIGVIASQKNALNTITGGSMPEFIYVPYTTANAIRGEDLDTIDQIAIKPKENSEVKCMQSVQAFLSKQQGANSQIKVENISGYIDNINLITFFISLFISGIAGISLFVALMGVVSTMLTATNERKREIGIYIALGMAKKDILCCFILECVIICFVGGFCGIISSYVTTLLLKFMLSINFTLDLNLLLFTLFVSTVGGVLSGIAPALKATKLDPIKSLQ